MLKVGSWKLEEFKSCHLPQKAATAFTNATMDLTGASYQPLLFIGTQIVNGVNYCFIAEQTLVLAEPRKRIVKLIINEAPNGKCSIVNVNSIGIKD